MHLSPSQLEAFNCRLSWYWGTVKGYTSTRVQPALELGLGVHLALEKYYAANKHPVKVFLRWADQRLSEIDTRWDGDLKAMLDIRALGATMLRGYLKRYHHKEPFRVVTTEHTCERPLLHYKTKEPLPGVSLLVRVDAIVEDTNLGKLFVLEHKTFSQFNLGQLERDHQFVAEAWVANPLAKELEGRPISGVIYNGLRKQIPSSRSKLELFERHHVYVNKHQVRTLLQRCYHVAAVMCTRPVSIYPEPSLMRCNMCPFKEPCTEYMRGGDYQFLLDNLFLKRPRKEVHSED